jgi:alkylation response protein AidB-like acyl-CoA dehydrogenase
MTDGAVQLARTFTHEIVRPNVRAWESSGRYPRKQVAASGLTGMFSPAADGGLDLAFPQAAGVFEELGPGGCWAGVLPFHAQRRCFCDHPGGQ